MSLIYGKCKAAYPFLGTVAWQSLRHFYRLRYSLKGVYQQDSEFARQRLTSLQEKLSHGETVYLVGLGVAGHNTGVSLVEVSTAHGPRLISNDEEERFIGIKHYDKYPEMTLNVLKERLKERDLTPCDIDAWLLSWDYPRMLPFCLRTVFESFPYSLPLLHPKAMPKWKAWEYARASLCLTERLQKQLKLPHRPSVISLRHHDNHAAFSFALSPFNQSTKPVIVTVIDGSGDEGAISLYVARAGKLEVIRKNYSMADSLGVFYSIISSIKGGWTSLSSEGRYMGAVAWGDRNRLTNPFYKRLRQIFYFGEEGHVLINRAMANWQNAGEWKPCTPLLKQIVGDIIPLEKMWNPDAVLNIKDINHSEITRERVDMAAATQLVFEDVLFHIIDYLIRKTGSDQLVLTGGTALNCLANMKLLEQFDESWYRRNLKQKTRLHLWVPPTPGDAGVTVGAAYNFSVQAGVRFQEKLQHAFYCGRAATDHEINTALYGDPEIQQRPLGNLQNQKDREQAADMLAYLIARDAIVGIYQGPAETGPRALGHRSILANPCNPKTLENINKYVKMREPIRPLASMATLRAAQRFFELSEGASDDDFNAYNYMVLAVRALPHAYKYIPATIHHDGTSRIQIVRPGVDPFMYDFLQAMGRWLGVEVSVNTSLNVGGPIVQTPQQALTALKRSQGMSGLVMIGASGSISLVWYHLKDQGRQLLGWCGQWEHLKSSQ